METAQKTFAASDVVRQPEVLSMVRGYALIVDTSISQNHDNMVKALNTLDSSWRVVQMAAREQSLYVLLYR